LYRNVTYATAEFEAVVPNCGPCGEMLSWEHTRPCEIDIS
jgi:hypothetical protein